jgi:hypothetical protein
MPLLAARLRLAAVVASSLVAEWLRIADLRNSLLTVLTARDALAALSRRFGDKSVRARRPMSGSDRHDT